MKELTFLFLLLSGPGLSQCFPVTASQGGNRTAQLFFCEFPGCAANVTKVFCNDEPVIDRTNITDCTGAPPLNTVCQRDGRAFVSIDTDGECEFEGEAGQIQTKKCTDHSNICVFDTAPVTTSAPVTTEEAQKDDAKAKCVIIGVVCGLVVLLIVGLILYLCKKRRNRKQQPASDSDVIVPLREREQSPEETSERDTRGGPGLDDDRSPSPPDHGA